MTKDMTFQHVSWTLSFPGKHVVGVFGSLQEAEQAVQALVDAGYHVEDMALIPSQDFPSAFQEHLRKGDFCRLCIIYKSRQMRDPYVNCSKPRRVRGLLSFLSMCHNVSTLMR